MHLNISLNLPLLRMLMGEHSESNYCLVFVLNRPESLTELPCALISIWNMTQKNSSSVVVLETLQLVLVVNLGQAWSIVGIASRVWHWEDHVLTQER